MSYQYFVQEEHNASLLAMFEWVTFDNQVEDTANYVMSEPMTDPILIRNTSILRNEVTSLWLTPDRTQAILFNNTSNYPTDDFTLLTWIRPYANTGTAYRGFLDYGALRLAVANVGEETFDVRLEVYTSSYNETLPISDDGYMVMVVRSGDDYSLYIDNVFITTLTIVPLIFSTSSVRIGFATGWMTDAQAELDMQAVTLFPTALTQQQRNDIWTIVTIDAIVRTVDADTEIDFENENVRVLQTEWHSVLI